MGSLDEIDFGDSQKKSIKSSSIKDIPKRFKAQSHVIDSAVSRMLHSEAQRL